MSLTKLRWISLRRLLLTPDKLLIKRGVSIRYLEKNENLILNKVLVKNEEFNNDKWSLIREDLCKSDLSINDVNVDCVIIDRCWVAQKQELAVSYVQYLLRTEKKKLNIGTIGRYFKALYDTHRPLDTQEIEEIYRLYDELMEEYPVVDPQTAQNLISGLSLTERWKECLKLLNMIENSGSSRSTSYSSIISAAFDHNDFTLGWKYLEDMHPRLHPNYYAYNSFLNYCKRVSKNTPELEYVVNKIFKLWKNNDTIPPLNIVMLYVDTLTSTGEWTAEKITIEKNGFCGGCKQTLEPLSLDEKEFKYLSHAVLSNTLVGDDIYNKSTPGELRRFKEFVNSTKPYDVCIDGLNVAYTLNRTKKTSNLGKELAAVVAEFIKENKKVFVLGRKHMTKWSPKDMEFVRKNCYIFFAHDLSQDDPFLLYASLTSGMKTHFVSRDLMRQHKFLIQEEKAQQAFRHWQQCRQIFPIYVGTNFHRTLLLIRPPKYLPIAQQDSNGWHLPYFDESSSVTRAHDINIPEAPKTWICLRKKL
ncbi:mitochondrial ribonuclease P catalytic subunit [Cotesia typhae]